MPPLRYRAPPGVPQLLRHPAQDSSGRGEPRPRGPRGAAEGAGRRGDGHQRIRELPPLRRVVVGTEAVLHQAGRADAVAFIDFDQELLAPRYRASEQAFALLARGARVVAASRPSCAGRAHGQLVVQTRLPDDDVVQAALQADPTRVSEAEAVRRRLLGFPPETAMAAVSGAAAPAFVDAFGRPPGLEVLGPSDGTWLLRAADHGTLCDALASTPRPRGRRPHRGRPTPDLTRR